LLGFDKDGKKDTTPEEDDGDDDKDEIQQKLDEHVAKSEAAALEFTKGGLELLADLYLHYQFGFKRDYVIPTSRLDFSKTSQKKLGLKQEIGKQTVKLIELTGYNPISLAFGTVDFYWQGGNQFSITDHFDFNHEKGASLSRNLGTLGASLIFGRVFNAAIPVYYNPVIPIQPNYFFGGDFKIIFRGTVTINP